MKSPTLWREKYFWHLTTSIMDKQLHKVSSSLGRRSLWWTLVGVYPYRPAAAEKDFWSGSRWRLCFPGAGWRERVTAFSWQRMWLRAVPQGRNSCLLSGVRWKHPAFINSEDAQFIGSKCFDSSTRNYSSATVWFFLFFFFNRGGVMGWNRTIFFLCFYLFYLKIRKK